MKKLCSLLTIASLLLMVPVTSSAGMLFFDVDSNPSGWMASVSGTTESSAYDFNLDAYYPGAPAFFGPLTSAGAGPVSPGIVSPNVTISSLVLNPVLIADLFAIGPSSLGNSANAVYSNQRNNGLTIEFADPVTAFEFNVLAFDSDWTNLRFFDAFGAFEEFGDVPVDGGIGHRIGILGTGGTLISRVDIFVPATGGYEGNGGSEGLTGAALMYRGQTIPIPSSDLLIGLGLIMLFCGHRWRYGSILHRS